MSITAAAAPAGLNEFDMEKQTLQGAAEFRGLLEFGGAPWNCEIMVDDHVADPIDDDMCLAPAVGADEIFQIVETTRSRH